MSGKVAYLRKDDEVAEKRHKNIVAFMEQMTELVRQRKLHAMVFVGIEHVTDDDEVESVVHRDYVSGSTTDLMTLLGANGLVVDEMSNCVRAMVTE